MLQELTFGRLENEYYEKEAKETDVVICVNNNLVLLKRDENNQVLYPTAAEVLGWAKEEPWHTWKESKLQYLFRMQEKDYYLWMGEAGDALDAAYGYGSICRY